MLRGDGLLLGLVADLIGLGGDEVNELGAAVDHQFPGIVGHPHAGQSLFDHLVDGSPGDGEVVIVPGGGGHVSGAAEGGEGADTGDGARRTL